MKFKSSDFTWTRPPKIYTITDDKITITTEPNTDLWQRTYYGFQNDNAPVLQKKISEKYFSFITKTHFNSKTRFDQSGIVRCKVAQNIEAGITVDAACISAVCAVYGSSTRNIAAVNCGSKLKVDH